MRQDKEDAVFRRGRASESSSGRAGHGRGRGVDGSSFSARPAVVPLALLTVGLIVVSLVLLIAMVGCGSTAAGGTTSTTQTGPTSTGAGQGTGTVEVVMKNIKFVPDTVTIKVGQTVTWVNQDSAQHDVVANQGEFKSQLFDQGQSFSFTFTKAGTYKYYCSIHPQMLGTVIVQ
jgi:plastocyanin